MLEKWKFPAGENPQVSFSILSLLYACVNKGLPVEMGCFDSPLKESDPCFRHLCSLAFLEICCNWL